jgi:hypothetical protein
MLLKRRVAPILCPALSRDATNLGEECTQRQPMHQSSERNARPHRRKRGERVTYFAFDLLFLNGRNLVRIGIEGVVGSAPTHPTSAAAASIGSRRSLLAMGSLLAITTGGSAHCDRSVDDYNRPIPAVSSARASRRCRCRRAELTP